MYKDSLILEQYLLDLPFKSRRVFTLFRCRNHRLPVETSIYNGNIETVNCTLCNENDVGDEFHYLFKCTHFRPFRELYLKRYYWNHTSAFKYSKLMNSRTFISIVNSIL